MLGKSSNTKLLVSLLPGELLLTVHSYCASPISGMGTTLAMSGAYHLAGALTQSPDDHTAAFAEYEKKMRPVVERAQKLVPGAPHILSPETAWGVWFLNTIVGLLAWTALIKVLFKYLGPAAKKVKVDDYGFKQLPELSTSAGGESKLR